MMKPDTVSNYIAELPPPARTAVSAIRRIILKSVPKVTERISYGIPTFSLDDQYFLYLAGWKKHISLYPITKALSAELGEELAPYESGKSSLKFPLDEKLPLDLIRRIVRVRLREARAR